MRKQLPIRRKPKQEEGVWKIFEDMGSSLDKMGEDAYNLV